jgi:hypothetical protein
VILLWQRQHQKFRGQIFFLFAFAYGYLRFLIEMLRDDSERGEFGTFPLHLFIPGALAIMALAFVFGISLGITNLRTRMVARVVAFVPPVVAYVMLAPAKFGEVTQAHPSTSQWIGLLSGLVCAYFYAQAWEVARKSPKAAMSLESLGDLKPVKDEGPARRRRDEDEDEDGDGETADRDGDEAAADAEAEARPKKKKGKKKKGLKAPAAKVADADGDEDAKADDEAEAKADEESDAPGAHDEKPESDKVEAAKDAKADKDKAEKTDKKEPAESA